MHRTAFADPTPTTFTSSYANRNSSLLVPEEYATARSGRQEAMQTLDPDVSPHRPASPVHLFALTLNGSRPPAKALAKLSRRNMSPGPIST